MAESAPTDSRRTATRDWRRLVPPRWGWLRLVASPTSFLLVLAFALTLNAKARVLAAASDVDLWLLRSVVASAGDAILLFGLAAVFAVGERRSRWLYVATGPLAAFLFSFAFVNARYLAETGEQLSWQVVALGIERFGDFAGIASEQLARRGVFGWLLAIVLFLGAPAAAAFVLGKFADCGWPRFRSFERAHCAAVVTAVATIVWLVTPSPSGLTAQRVYPNAAISTYVSFVTDDSAAMSGFVESARFDGYRPPYLVTPEAAAAFAAKPDRPNIVLFVLESTRYDATSIAGVDTGPGSRTPAIAALAARGLSVDRARAVLPHTTKSLFSILCARFPLMQLTLFETNPDLQVECLPAVLRRAGYHTAFYQSALGSFENRPRLAARFGYRYFFAWEDLDIEPLGYLSGDDEGLAPPAIDFFDRWQKSADGKPFFVTLLTSGPHHPYDLTTSIKNRLETDPSPTGNIEQRYARLVEAQDHMIGKVVAELETRGLLDNTLVIVVGDHGEGFGEKGIRQHDNNFFEEGLHVPIVIAGPGVRAQSVAGNRSLVDVTPTLLDLLDIPIADETRPDVDGHTLLAAAPDRPRYFTCWYDNRCRGFVYGDRKVIVVPETGHKFYFDLATDPAEQRPLSLTPELAALLPKLDNALERRRTFSHRPALGELEAYPAWTCPAKKPCRHSRSPGGSGFHSSYQK